MGKLALVLALVAAAASFAAGWTVRGGRDAAGALAAARGAVAVAERAGLASQRAAVADQRGQDRERTVTRTLIEKVPVYVTPAADARFPLPLGFVRLHDAAAAGVDLPAAPPGPAGADDAASGVAAADAARVVVANYGACRADQARLAALQAWARDEGLAK